MDDAEHTASHPQGPAEPGTQFETNGERPGRRELGPPDFRAKRALWVVAAILLTIELVARLWGTGLSGDLRQLEQLPARAAHLSTLPAPRVLILGNSYTNLGLHWPTFDQAWQAFRTTPLSLELVALDGAHIVEWLRILEQDFVGTGHPPDVLVLNVQTCLRDQSGLFAWRLAAHARARMLPRILEQDVETFDARAELLQDWLFASFAGRERVRLAAMDAMVPGYRDVRRQVHRMIDSPEDDSPGTWHHLDALLELTHARAMRLLVVAMPARERYALEPALTARLDQGGARLIDLRNVTGLSASSFIDPNHLSPEGARVFSREYAAKLSEAIND